MLGVLPSVEAHITHIDNIVVEGRYLLDKEENTFLISTEAAEKLNAFVGDKFLLRFFGLSKELELVGIFDDRLFNKLIDLDGEPITPKKLILIDPGNEVIPPTYEAVSCDSSEIIITTWQTSLSLYIVFLSRIDIQVNDVENILSLARRLALERDYWVWTSTGEQVYLTALKSYVEAKGLPILVPWLIVILTVITTMLNAIFERRREIGILSSIGLNPAHITALFVAEASIIGIVGAGIGYLSGLSLYQFISLEVRQKISAVWVLAALGISATAVVIGAMVALRSSVIITPSLLRRWKVKDKKSSEEPWDLTMPIELRQKDVTSFIDYVRKHLEYEQEVDVQHIKKPSEAITKLKFTYRFGGTHGLTINELVVTKKEEDAYTIKLISKGDKDSVYKTATFVRKLILKWSTVRNEI